MTAPADSRPEPMEVSEGVAEGEPERNAAAVPRLAAHAGAMHAVPDSVVGRQSREDSEESPLGAMQDSGGPQSPGLGGQQPGVPGIPRILASGPGMDGAVFRFGAHGGGNPGLGQVPQQHHQHQHIQHSVLPSSPVPGLPDLDPVHPLAEVPPGGPVPAAALAALAHQQQQMQQQQVPQSMDEEGRNNGLGRGGGGGGAVVPVVPPVSAMVADEPQALVSTAVPAVSSATTTTSSSSLMSQVYQWRIENFSTTDKKVYSKPPFAVGGYYWRILIFPKGNQGDQLSLYLDVADAQGLPFGWSRFADFTLAVVNQIDRNQTIRKEAKHQFNARESDWGFTAFMPLAELYDTSRGFIVNDTLIVEAEVHVRPDPWAYDSKKETGFVGLKNQGATCYMNSLLQTLYHIPHFRKAVYHMPTTESDNPSNSIPLALQSLFYRLQYSDSGSVATKELTRSFGWDTYDSFMQHDVQELNRVLCEKLEDKMKGTSVEGTIQHLFEGHIMNYIECVNVDFKSTRKESFLDLQLDVKGCKDVYASFDKYTEVEMLTGDNKYHAEQHGLQDAKKGVLFLDFPPVLQLQLKRFEYDFERDTMVKINDRYEFPLQLDLDIGNFKYLAPVADKSTRNLYSLHSVLVHSGGVHGGHYYAFIRPTLTDQWYKFDDERVTKEDTKKALDEQFGGEDEMPAAHPPPFKFTKYSNAYMLVYVRDVDRPKILCHVDESDIAEHLQVRLRKEQEEKERKRKEKAEAHLYTIIKVATDEDLRQQIGNHLFFDLVDHDRIDRVHTFRIEKQKKFSEFKEEVARVLGMPVELQRYWLWSKRQNATYRPSRPLTPEEETFSVGKLKEANNKTHTAELKLFLELPQGLMPPQLHPQAQPQPPAANNNSNNNNNTAPQPAQHHQQQQQQQQPQQQQQQQQQQGDQTNQAPVVAVLGAAGGPNPSPHMQLEKIKDSILLFFKLYDPRTETVKYVGRLFVRPSSKPMDIIPKLNEMAGFKPDEEILLFEEIKYEPSVMCEPVDKRLSFKASQLEDGDIICFQRAAPDDDEGEGADCKSNGTGSQRDTPMTPSPETPLPQPAPAATAAAMGDGLAPLPNAVADGTAASPAALGSGRRGRTDGAVPMDADSDSGGGGGNGGAHGAVLRDGAAAQRSAQGPQAMVQDGGQGAAADGVVVGDAARPVGVHPQQRIRFHDVPSFLEYVRNRQVVHFRRLDKPKEEDFSLELSKQHTYDDVVERVAERVGIDDPSKIRLTMHNVFSQQPKPPAIKYRGVDRLADMLLHYNQTSDILYYEILDMPLPELQQLKTLRMAFHNNRTEEVSVHTLRLPKQSTVADLLGELRGKVELSSPDAELRMFQVFCHKIFKVFPPTEVIDTINDTYLTLRAEEVPEEERVLGPGDRLVHVYHIAPSPASADLNLTVGNPQQQHNSTGQQQPLQQPQPQQQPQQQLFGDPFFLLLRESDTVADLRQRIRQKLQVPDDEFAKWRLAFISANSVQFLEDADVVSPRFQKREPWEHYLGLEHPDANPRRPHQHHNNNQNRHAYERPVKIYN